MWRMVVKLQWFAPRVRYPCVIEHDTHFWNLGPTNSWLMHMFGYIFFGEFVQIQSCINSAACMSKKTHMKSTQVAKCLWSINLYNSFTQNHSWTTEYLSRSPKIMDNEFGSIKGWHREEAIIAQYVTPQKCLDNKVSHIRV